MLALLCRILLLTTSRVAVGYRMASSSSWGCFRFQGLVRRSPRSESFQCSHTARGHRSIPRFAGVFVLLRSCTGRAKVLFSCRTDTHWPLTFPAWLSPKSSVHASGLVSTNMTFHDGLLRSDTESSLISSFLPNANIYGSSDTPSQKRLSAKNEAHVCQHLFQRAPPLGTLRSQSRPWSWGLASRSPSKLTSLLRSFGSAFAVASVCPSCPGFQLLSGQVLVRWGDDALANGCGGDRVSRHILIRDVVHSAADDRSNLATVLEKPGLLTPVTPFMMIAPQTLTRLISPMLFDDRPTFGPNGAPAGDKRRGDFSITSAI